MCIIEFCDKKGARLSFDSAASTIRYAIRRNVYVLTTARTMLRMAPLWNYSVDVRLSLC
jgi:hypothetical protein